MKKIILIFTVLLSFTISNNLYSQCTISASPHSITICKGDSVIITARGSCDNVVTEDFNSGQLDSTWTSFASPVFNNPCSPSFDGTPYLWIDSATNFPRELVSCAYDLSSGSCLLSFNMRYAIDGDASPCEGPDLPTEGVHLQYSAIGTPGPWTDVNYWYPNGGHDTARTNWNMYTEIVPPAAVTTSTWFRWYQTNTTANNHDHWGLDNVNMTCPTAFNVSWAHGPTVLNPPTVYPIFDTMFIITICDTAAGSIPVSDTVFVNVNPSPTLFAVTGGGSYIQGGNGVSVGLDNSQMGVEYSLIFNGSITVTSISGTGSPIDFGLQTVVGTYTVSAIILASNCSKFMNDSAVVSIYNSIEENKIVDFNIYPNPTNGIFAVEGENIELVSITDISGKVILEIEVKEDNIEIDLSEYSKAIYFVNVYTEDGVGVKKILIE